MQDTKQPGWYEVFQPNIKATKSLLKLILVGLLFIVCQVLFSKI